MKKNEYNAISKMLSENFREIDILSDYWKVRGEVREFLYKLENVLKMIRYTILIECNQEKYEMMKTAKESNIINLEQLKIEYDYLNKNHLFCTIDVENIMNSCISLASELIEWLKLQEKIQEAIFKGYQFMISTKKTNQNILNQKCKNNIMPSLTLIDFYNEYNFYTPKDLDRIDNINIVIKSTRIIDNENFKNEWAKQGITNNFSNLLRIRNWTENITKIEKEYSANLDYSIKLGEQLDKETVIKQNKNLNLTMLLLAIIGSIGVLNSILSTELADNISLSLLIIVFCIAVVKWLTYNC